MKKVFFLVITLLIASCGTSEDCTCEAGPCYLAGDHTPEEAHALAEVQRAIEVAGYTLPGFAVNFVHSPDTPFKETTWAKWRCGVQPRNPAEGYRGWCDRPWCMIFIRRYGEARPYLYELLVHELMHAVGFDHGREMKKAEAKVLEHIL